MNWNLEGQTLTKLQDVRQTSQYVNFIERIGWEVDKISPKNTFIFIKKLPILPFSVIKILRYQGKLQLDKLKKFTKKHKAILVKLEPFEIEKMERSQVYLEVLKKNKWPLTPTKTLWFDLSKPEKQILSEMKPKTRYNIRLAQKKKIKVKIVPGDKITNKKLYDFFIIWKKNRPHNFLFKPSFNELKYLVESFGNKCFFVFALCRHSESASWRTKNPAKRKILRKLRFLDSSLTLRMTEESLIAACLILTSSNMAFYWHNASTRLGKKLFAPTLCVWQAINEAKRRKLRVFDFEGVWDERYPNLNKGWKGFTKFKEGFIKR